MLQPCKKMEPHTPRLFYHKSTLPPHTDLERLLELVAVDGAAVVLVKVLERAHHVLLQRAGGKGILYLTQRCAT